LGSVVFSVDHNINECMHCHIEFWCSVDVMSVQVHCYCIG